MRALEDVLLCGDNLPVLREQVADGSVDLCYSDPPFFSRRDHRSRSLEGEGDVRGFTDRWAWGEEAEREWQEVREEGCKMAAAAALLRGLREAFGEGPLLAYLVSLTLRVAEIRRVLAAHGTLYLHVDASAAHYLKTLCDALFLPGGGEFRNEIVWSYESGGRGTRDFPWKHDTILRYTKSGRWTFDAAAVRLPRATLRRNHLKRETDADGRVFHSIKSAGKVYRYYEDEGVVPSDVWTDLSHLHQRDPERVGYPTQKPEALLARIIAASSRPGDLVLDAYCGGGTTLAAAQKLGRRWVGIDRNAEAIAVARQRLAGLKGRPTPDETVRPGIPPAGPTTTTGPTPG